MFSKLKRLFRRPQQQGVPPESVNNAIRQIMAEMREVYAPPQESALRRRNREIIARMRKPR